MDDRMERQWRAAQAIRARLIISLERRFGFSADDIVDEAIARCATAASIGGEEHAQAWTARTAEALAVDAWRHERAARRGAPRWVEPASASPEDIVMDRDLRRATAAAVAELPADQRAVLTAVAEGLPLLSIAARLGRTPCAVKHLLHSARARVRARLADGYRAVGLLVARWRERGGEEFTRTLVYAPSEWLLALRLLLLSVIPPLALLAGAMVDGRDDHDNRPALARGAPGSHWELREPGEPTARSVAAAGWRRAGSNGSPPGGVALPDRSRVGPVSHRHGLGALIDGIGGSNASSPDQAPDDLKTKIADVIVCVEHGVHIHPEKIHCRPGEAQPAPWLQLPGVPVGAWLAMS